MAVIALRQHIALALALGGALASAVPYAFAMVSYGAVVDGGGVGFPSGVTGALLLAWAGGAVGYLVGVGLGEGRRVLLGLIGVGVWMIGLMGTLVTGLPRSAVRRSIAAQCEEGRAIACGSEASYLRGGTPPRDGARADLLDERACRGGWDPSCFELIERDAARFAAIACPSVRTRCERSATSSRCQAALAACR